MVCVPMVRARTSFAHDGDAEPSPTRHMHRQLPAAEAVHARCASQLVSGPASASGATAQTWLVGGGLGALAMQPHARAPGGHSFASSGSLGYHSHHPGSTAWGWPEVGSGGMRMRMALPAAAQRLQPCNSSWQRGAIACMLQPLLAPRQQPFVTQAPALHPPRTIGHAALGSTRSMHAAVPLPPPARRCAVRSAPAPLLPPRLSASLLALNEFAARHMSCSVLRAAAAVALSGGIAAASGLRHGVARKLHWSRSQQYLQVRGVGRPRACRRRDLGHVRCAAPAHVIRARPGWGRWSSCLDHTTGAANSIIFLLGNKNLGINSRWDCNMATPLPFFKECSTAQYKQLSTDLRSRTFTCAVHCCVPLRDGGQPVTILGVAGS